MTALPQNDDGDSTRLLQAMEQRLSSADELLPLVYSELRQLAAARMAREAAGQTLQPTALVHEAWLRLMGGNQRVWHNRAHFFAAAAEAMRRIMIERARRKMSLKRGSRPEHVNIQDVDIAETPPDERVLLIDEALRRLKAKDSELAQIVTLKFFGGLTNGEAAELLGVTERTVRSKWAFARAWLVQNIRKELTEEV
jgi:RNA polymerase sigma factor (TIGR02999 family)